MTNHLLNTVHLPINEIDPCLTDRYRIHMITSTILSDVIEVVLNTKQKYKNILMVDRKLRDCAIELFGSSVGDRDVSESPFLILPAYVNCTGRPRNSPR